MESKKLEKPRKNGTFSTVQGVMNPDEEGRGVFPTMKPLGAADPAANAAVKPAAGCQPGCCRRSGRADRLLQGEGRAAV